MTVVITASIIEEGALARLESHGHVVLHDLDIAAGVSGAERTDSNYRGGVVGRNRSVRQRLTKIRMSVGGHG